MFGLPISGVAAAAIVVVFHTVVPPSKKFSFEMFGGKFSGPIVPATLWLATYLALVLSIVAISRANLPSEHNQSKSDTAAVLAAKTPVPGRTILAE